MTNIETNGTRLYRLAISLLVLLYAPAAFAQSGEVENTGGGITSFLFSTRSVTVILVLALVAQIVYRQRTRKATKEAEVAYTPLEDQAEKRRFDKEEMSKLLKASATAPKSGRSLEEAIRLSQMLQPALPSDLIGHAAAEEVDGLEAEAMEAADSEVVAVECEPVDVVEVDDLVILESEVNVAELNVETVSDIVEVEPVVEAQVQSVDVENAEQV